MLRPQFASRMGQMLCYTQMACGIRVLASTTQARGTMGRRSYSRTECDSYGCRESYTRWRQDGRYFFNSRCSLTDARVPPPPDEL